jgi:hypothetical protein
VYGPRAFAAFKDFVADPNGTGIDQPQA